jgi:hypothetical protein
MGAGAAAIIRGERTVLRFLPATGLREHSSEVSFYLSSRSITAKTAAVAVRQYRRIESVPQSYTRRSFEMN